MFYLSLVLLSTFIISTVIYISQLTANLWGRPRPAHDMQRLRARKPEPLPDKGIFLMLRRNKNKQDKEESKTETKENPVKHTNSSTKDDKLEVTIISNKQPLLEKIEPRTESEAKTLKSSWAVRIFSCLRRENKISVNLPRSEWLGPTDCTVKKTVKLSALSKVLKQTGEDLDC